MSEATDVIAGGAAAPQGSSSHADGHAVVRELRRPFTPEAVKFKVQQNLGKKGQDPSGALIVAYIDARLVIERLNHVVGFEWSDHYDLPWCYLTVRGITRSDVGEYNPNAKDDKAAVSDSLKRAAVHFGIGVSIYALPQIKLWINESQGALKLAGSSILITDSGQDRLRNGYAKWLTDHGTRSFGEPLDHGDVGNPQGDPDEAADEPQTPSEPTQKPDTAYLRRS